MKRFYSNPLTLDQRLIMADILYKDRKFSQDGHDCSIVNIDGIYMVTCISKNEFAFETNSIEDLFEQLHTYTYE